MDHKSRIRPQRSRDNDARVIRTRAALHRALLQLAERMSFSDITVTAIAEKAGVGYATFFRHFPDKQSLLADIAAELVDGLVVEMGLSATTDPALGGRKLARFIEEHHGICHALLVGAGDEMRRAIIERAYISSQPTAPPSIKGLPRGLLISHSVTATLALMTWSLEHPGAMREEQLAEALHKLVFAPVAALQIAQDVAS